VNAKRVAMASLVPESTHTLAMARNQD